MVMQVPRLAEEIVNVGIPGGECITRLSNGLRSKTFCE